MYIAQQMSWHKVSNSDNDKGIDDEQRECATVPEVTTRSTASIETVGANTTHEQSIENTASEEPMAYLHGLNSGNLMQFSQQSILQELMLQSIKPQLNTLPTLENHNNGGYDFEVVVKEPPKSHWMFSVPLNKVYIRMNKTLNIDVEFKTKMPIQPLNLRAFLCFVKEVSGPVLRCQNHLSTDPITNPTQRESLLRCENPAAKYCGTAEGKSIVDRYSVLIPLNMTCLAKGGYVRQTLAFKFLCQNSCFGRKETCLVFCLENASGEILGQQVLYVKICTCPKRDRNQDERHVHVQKRKLFPAISEDDKADVIAAKVTRRTTTLQVKEENDNSNPSEIGPLIPSNWELTRSPNGGYRLLINCPKKEMLLQNIEGMIEKTATAILISAQKPPHLLQHANDLLGLKKYALMLP